MARFLSDSLGRKVLLRSLAVVVVVLLAERFGWGWGLLAGVVGAVLLAADVTRRLAPLRTRVGALAPDEPPPGSLGDLAARVEEARERLAEARRKAEHERDDVLGILEATSEGILVLGHHHRIEMINDAARRMLQPPVDPLGRSLPEIVRVRELLDFAEALRRGEPLRARTVELADPGTATGTRTISVSGALVRGDHLRSRAVLALHDLTEQAHLESVRTDFVANVTHEMRSPLASILGYAETLATEADLEPGAQDDYLERILRNSRRLDDIIRDLIELSRLEHATAPEVRSTDAVGLLNEIVDGFADQARDRSVELEIEVAQLPPVLEIDAGLVRQAVTNLVDNAVKYTPAGGRVEVRARVRKNAGAEELEIAVADTGAGIPLEHQGRIFERFYRVDTARSRSLGGTGLGLAIVKHAAALHGGVVDLESSERGSTFRLVLPA